MVETMGVEVLEADLTQVPAKDGNKGDSAYLHENDDGKINRGPGLDEPIKFGLHGEEGPVEGKGNPFADVNFPKDAVDEWPAPKKIHCFYFFKFRSYEDPNLKAKIKQFDKEIQKKNHSGFQITEALQEKRWDRELVISHLMPLIDKDERFRKVVKKMRKEMEPLPQALGKLRSANNASRERGVSLCSSEEELNDLIQSLHYRIQHESNTLVEEKQLLREIKQLEGTREKVIASFAMKANKKISFGQHYFQLYGVDLDGVKKEQLSVRAKIKHLEGELKVIDNNISSLQKGLTVVNQKKDKAYEGILELRKQRDEGNANYYQNRSLLNNARELAAKKDILTLEELSHTEVEKFMSLWSSSKAFRDDYEKRILSSLDGRQLSRDGRMRNPDEKPLVLETPTPTESDTVVKGNVKRKKEDSKPPPQHDIIPTPNVQKENIPTEAEPTIKGGDLEDREHLWANLPFSSGFETDAYVFEIFQECEKRAKNKASAPLHPTNHEEQIEADKEVVEPEMFDINAPVPSKNKKQNENTIRYRNQSQGQDPLPKVILKWKKSTPYWVWAAPAALVVLMLVCAWVLPSSMMKQN
ncbi:hypothetical protein HHK36_005312 [Tetracentron sinense]|uniref:Proton pump-interactor 1 n=1 Tax=Tetracentron sinense TaxID=13715 RepID=A0A834ZQ45_TETSI|nr:hypothetical protein HHK36_005312 [Tetracentron sinense]